MTIRYLPVLFVALATLCGCREKPPIEPVERSFRKPTAQELFELESKCNAMGGKVLENNVVGSALTQSQVSHYNATDNRCYVLLTVDTADLRTPLNDVTSDSFLDDGQSGEILASRYCKGHSCTATVLDDDIKGMVKDPMLPSETEVRDLMDRFVHTTRALQPEKAH